MQVLPYQLFQGALCLDGACLANLALVAAPEGGTAGTLLAALDTCRSPGVLRHAAHAALARLHSNIAAHKHIVDGVGNTTRVQACRTVKHLDSALST